MHLTLQSLFLILFFCLTVCSQQGVPGPPQTPKIGPGTGAYTEEPRAILRAADEALRSTRSVTYDAVYQGSGAMATRSPVAVGKASLSKLPADNRLMAKLAASGAYFSEGSDEKLAFHTTFDGETIRRMRP